MNFNKNIGIIMGGCSNEHEISLKSGEVVYETLISKFKCYRIIINKENWFMIDRDKKKYEIDQKTFKVKKIPKLKFDCIFNAVHGSPGEDGIIQKYFNKLNIPITGSSSYASELTFDKIKCINYLRSKGIKTSNSITINNNESINLNHIENRIGFPCFVKASKSGSSFGVYKVYSQKELNNCLKSAFKIDKNVLIESFVKGKEFSVGVISYKNNVEALPITEIIASNDFFDFEAKYSGKSREITPAKISSRLKYELQSISKNIFNLLKLKGFTRSEFIVNKSGIYFLETNTVPGLTHESILPQQLKCANISLDDLFINAINEVTN
tara:strand:- start:684 stop:1658 length:975 start_codon:yes stop_codon:yes gene_type:complete